MEHKSSKSLLAQKWPNLAVDLNKIHRRQDLPICGSLEFGQIFSNLQRIKHPALRAVRLKLCFKNIFSNERRNRFGLTDSPLCASCQQVETVEHQAYECDNAQRLWSMYRTVTNKNVGSFKDLILCGSNLQAEILKSAIIKALIQVHRNDGVPLKVIARECAYFLMLEAVVNGSYEKALLELVGKLNNHLSQFRQKI